MARDNAAAACVLLLSALLVCLPASAGDTIRVGGVGSALGSMRLLGEAFEKSHPAVKVNVLPSLGTSGGVGAVDKGAIDIGLAGRPLQERERVLGLNVREYARSPIVFVVNPDVAVNDISLDTVVSIYQGQLAYWPDGQRVRPVLRPSGDSDIILLESISPEMRIAVEAALSRYGMPKALTDQENADIIQRTPGAFGTSTLTQIVSEKRYIRMLSYNGVKPVVETRANGAYPFMKRFFLVTKPNSSAEVQQFIEFIQSPEGRKILEEAGNLPVQSGLRP